MDRDCKNCIYARTPDDPFNNGCTAWDCEYINRKEAIAVWKEYIEEYRESIKENDMGLCDFYVKDKSNGHIHKVGTDRHDSIWVDFEGTLHYQNIQNGDGCSYKSAKDNLQGYEFVPSDCMGVYIRDMEKPKGCWDCFNWGCDHWAEHGYDNTDDCPLIEIVQCKDCKYGHKHILKDTYDCDKSDITVFHEADFFCKASERRE